MASRLMPRLTGSGRCAAARDRSRGPGQPAAARNIADSDVAAGVVAPGRLAPGRDPAGSPAPIWPLRCGQRRLTPPGPARKDEGRCGFQAPASRSRSCFVLGPAPVASCGAGIPSARAAFPVKGGHGGFLLQAARSARCPPRYTPSARRLQRPHGLPGQRRGRLRRPQTARRSPGRVSCSPARRILTRSYAAWDA
jgi:hypothetical protein